MTVSVKNVRRKAPAKFLKVKKAVSILSNAAVVMLLAAGYGESSLAMLIARVAISAVMEAAEALLAE